MLQLRNKTSDKGPLWLVEQKYIFGSDSSCDIRVAGALVKSQHVELLVNGDNAKLVNIGGSGLALNGKSVENEADLKPGDVLRLGDSQFELVDPKAAKAAKPAPSQAQNSNGGWAFKALNTALADKQFPLNDGQVIGRSQECDICLGVVHLSRKHAKVTVTDRGLHIQDLNSSNGTFINGKKVNQGTAIAGDEVSFDSLRFRVIGPVIDEDKTTIRPSSDGDLTTIRPALNVPPSAAPSKAKPAKAKPRPVPASQASSIPTQPTGAQAAAQVTAPQQAVKESEGGSNKTLVIALAVIALVAVVAVAVFV